MNTLASQGLSLADHKRLEMSLLTDLERLREYGLELDLNKSVKLLDEVIERIKTCKFSIAVVGEFKRGKSTFINALLGREILPSDLLPCSATLNRVTYGLEPSVHVSFKDGRNEVVAIDQLANYVTKLDPDAEALAATVKEAVVYYPVGYCQNNVDIIDTPGLNDDSNMTDVTLSVLPSVDAAILVVMAMSPFSEYERDFLENKLLTADLGRVLFVVSAIDRLNSPEDADKVVKAVRDRIKKHVVKRAEEQFGAGSAELENYLLKVGDPRVYGLSAYQALQGRAKNDGELLTKSRFPEFEKALEKFLAEERGAVVLQIPLARAQATANEIIRAIDLRVQALSMKDEEFTPAYEAALKEMAELRTRKQAEQQKVDVASERLTSEILPLVRELRPRVEQAVITTVDAAVVSSKDITGGQEKRTAEKISAEIAEAVKIASQRHAEQIQMKVQEALLSEADRLQDFLLATNQVMHNIQARFIRGDNNDDATANAVCATLAIWTGFGGIWSGYREGGVKGAAMGTAVSVGTYLGGGMLLAALGVTAFTLPVSLGLMVASFFTGGWVTRSLFGGDKVAEFKDSVRDSVLASLREKLDTSQTESQVCAYIQEAFHALKAKVERETGALLDDTERTLREVVSQREHAKVLSTEENKDLEQMRERVLTINANAKALLQRLEGLNGQEKRS
jgi:hypothetical protein